MPTTHDSCTNCGLNTVDYGDGKGPTHWDPETDAEAVQCNPDGFRPRRYDLIATPTGDGR